MIRLVCLCVFLLIMELGCNESNSNTSSNDCSYEGTSCNDGFTCMMNGNDEYECVPIEIGVAGEEDANTDSMAGVTAGTYTMTGATDSSMQERDQSMQNSTLLSVSCDTL